MVDTASKVEEDMVVAAMVVAEADMEVEVDTSRAVAEVDTSKVMSMFTLVCVCAISFECIVQCPVAAWVGWPYHLVTPILHVRHELNVQCLVCLHHRIQTY